MLATLVLLALLAPAPKEKPMPPPPSVEVGGMTMTWHGTACETYFHAGGFFACRWHGSFWHGAWSCKDGVLSVTEWPMNQPECRSRWAVKLKCGTTGSMGNGAAWKIVPLAGKVH